MIYIALAIVGIPILILFALAWSKAGLYTGWLETKDYPSDEDLKWETRQMNYGGCGLFVAGLGLLTIIVYLMRGG